MSTPAVVTRAAAGAERVPASVMAAVAVAAAPTGTQVEMATAATAMTHPHLA
ncbi:MAG: hypothetical protein WAL41_13960 [Mycobacterium sp.]